MAVTDTQINPLFGGPAWTSHQFVNDEVVDDQFKHHLSMMFYGMSDLGECLEIARTLLPNDEEAWLTSWSSMAQRLQDRAEQAERRNKNVTAAATYLRASTYWRASLMHFGWPDDPRQKSHAITSNNCYQRYLDLSGYPGEYVEIPYEGSFLPAYFYRSPVADAKAPVLIFNQGRDAWPEDTRWVYDGAIKRGIHCLAFHGPGQGLAIRLNDLRFRHDWEKVITPVVDFTEAIPGVDPNRIAAMGLSFGGYLVPRAAAFEKRLKVAIANPGVLSWGDSILSGFPPPLREAFDAGRDVFNNTVAASTAGSDAHGWFLRDASWKHGVSTPFDLFQEFLACDNSATAGQITCEMLLMDGTEETFSAGQSQRLMDVLTCPKHLMLFDKTTTAQLHCQNGANATASEMMFDWLDERL